MVMTRVSSGRAIVARALLVRVPYLRPPPHLEERKLGLHFKSWNGANKLEVNRITSKLKEDTPKKKEGKRGNIKGNTWKSMARMKSSIAEVECSVVGYTSCLTYPSGSGNHLAYLCPKAYESKRQFEKLSRWISKKMRWLGIYWKREPQQCGVTHYHLLYFVKKGGHTEDEVLQAMRRIMVKWCEITTGDSTSPLHSEHEKQLSVHLHETNFQSAKKGDNLFNYLGKYLSKDSGDVPEGYDDEGGGKWWGKINKDKIPTVKPKEGTIKLSDKKETAVMRALYRLRDRRKQAAYDSLHHTGKPLVSRDKLARAIHKDPSNWFEYQPTMR